MRRLRGRGDGVFLSLGNEVMSHSGRLTFVKSLSLLERVGVEDYFRQSGHSSKVEMSFNKGARW